MPYTQVMTGTVEIPPEVLSALGASFSIAAAQQNIIPALGVTQYSGDANQINFSFAKLLEIDSSQDAELEEYEDPDSVPLAGSTSTVTAKEYGRVVTTTSLADTISGGALGRQAAAAVGRDAGRWENIAAGKVLAAGTNTDTVGGVMTPQVMNRAYTELSMAGATKDASGFYRAILTPGQVYDLKNETGAGSWQDINKYSDPTTVLRGEVGTLAGFRIIESPLIATTGTGASTAHKAVFFGTNALGQGVATPVSLRVTTSDKLARFMNYGWYTCQVFSIIAQEQVYVVTTTSSINA